MKRIISLVLSLCMMMSLGIFVNAAGFSDLSANHWAYNDIMALVNEGTINGYNDGTFKPSKSVTRAEFVKMIGKWDQKYDGKYDDLSENHWAYEYIMWSGLDSKGTVIYPDVEIKRSDVINLIWKRNGSPKHDSAPKAISMQGTNSDATSWAYTIGLMKGDDGLNLRLDSSLTRAEAATLIIRSRKLVAENTQNNFVDVVSDDILKSTYEVLNLLGDTYNPNKVLTYAEIARMAIVFGADGGSIHFVGNDLMNNKKEVFEELGHKYDHEMFVLSTGVWGDDYYSLEKFDQPVTKQDAISAIMYGFSRRGTAPMSLGKQNEFYPDCKDASSTISENMYLSFANLNGIRIKTSKNLGANETLTVKEYSAFMLLFNEMIGLGISYSNGSKYNTKINTNAATMPHNFMDFKHTVAEAPTGIYLLKKDGVLAKDSYKSINLISSAYTGFLSEVCGLAKSETGYAMTATFYPGLSYKQDGNVVFAAKFSVKDNENTSSSIPVDKLLRRVLKGPSDYSVKPNSDFFVVFETYGPLMDMHLPYSGAYAKAIFVD